MNKKIEDIKKINVSKPLKLDCGKTVRDFPLAYETYGKLNENKDNAILVFHALTGDQFVTEINPVTNKEFTKTLGCVLNRPTFVTMPAFAARLALGEMADALLLASTRVEPKQLSRSRYKFRQPTLEFALRHLLGKTL